MILVRIRSLSGWTPSSAAAQQLKENLPAIGGVLWHVWTVKTGHEAAFVDAWNAMARWTITAFPDAHGRLLRDREQPNRFISFGPWPSEAAVAAWRASPEFQQYLALLREHLDDFTPGTFDLVSDLST